MHREINRISMKILVVCVCTQKLEKKVHFLYENKKKSIRYEGSTLRRLMISEGFEKNMNFLSN